ncbi:centrosomal P4.1-associated protein isoform X2 [Genypterus blacodes]|uniref:centrosomal P4.1-associated protein isoform X2 n=1 Tax=Genypterus blacodes TaxID=154954 RepID=UPI003F773724
MSSPAGLQCSQADILSRWIPSSSRAGVILSPCSELTGSPRRIPAVGPPWREQDTFSASDFAPLPASPDSSCPGGDDGLEPGSGMELAVRPQDLPVEMKLDQLRRWQLHMQEQLKAHQLEELLRLQEEQQKLLEMMDGSQHCEGDYTEESGLCGAEWEENTATGTCQGSSCSPPQARREEPLHRPQHTDTHEEAAGRWRSREDERDEEHCGDAERGSGDRPIRPGGGQKQTFEELLEEQLRLEEQRMKVETQTGARATSAPPKRAFLRRGQGLFRFTNNHKASAAQREARTDPRPQPLARITAHYNHQKGCTHGVRRLPVQPQTAVPNKENRPPQESRAAGGGKTSRTDLRGRNAQGGGSVRQTNQGQEQELKKRPSPPAQPARKPGPPYLATRPGQDQDQNYTGGREESGGSRLDSAEGRAGSAGDEGGGGGAGGPQYSFMSPLQDRLKLWNCDQQMENMELGEFELLEQAAEELSFSSTSSFVMKVLQMDQQHRRLQLHQRRFSSTPIKSPPSSSDGPRCKSLLDSRTSAMAAGQDVDVGDDCSEDEDGQQTPDLSSCSSSESGDQEVLIKPPLFLNAVPCLPVDTDPPYDNRAYEGASASCAMQEDGGGSVLSDTDDSTLMEDKDSRQELLVFDDDDTWSHGDETGPVTQATASGISPPERILTRKVAVSKAVEPDTGLVRAPAYQDPGPPPLPPPPPPPPTSQLMTRLFPSLKPKAQNAPLPPPSVAPESPGLQVQSRHLRERLVELEMEIERFKRENAALSRLRQENERNQENLRRERSEFEKVKAEELARFEEDKREENRKLQKERKVFEKHILVTRAMPDKKEREEIKTLKQQLSSLQEELKRRESRWSSAQSRLRQQISSLSEENTALKEEVSMLEKLRLGVWRKAASDSEKDRDTRDASLFENRTSTAIKTVQFASQLDRGSGPLQCSAAATRGPRRDGLSAAAGMKSSLKWPTASSSSSSSSSVRTEGEKSPDRPPAEEDRPSSSPGRDTKHHSVQSESECSEVTEVTHADGKVETVLAGGGRLIVFPNGTRKEVSADGLTAKVTFFNGDTKEIMADQRVIYFYAGAQTTHTTFPDGVEVLHFPNNQTEKHFPDGHKEITFPDQTAKMLFPDGREESVLMDGTVVRVNPDGTKEIRFNTGQREIHTADYKKREYPDGTVKTVHADGRQETSYPNGRLRVKDKDGNVLLDQRA